MEGLLGLSNEKSNQIIELGFQPIEVAVDQCYANIIAGKKGERQVFPTKWNKFNKLLLGGLQPGKMYVIAGRPGCLSGNTKIWVSRKTCSSGRWYSLKTIYEKYNDLIKKDKWNLNKPTRINSYYYDNDETALNLVEGVIYSGKKITYTLKTESGNCIRATKDHKFLINKNDKFKPLSELKVGDYIFSRYKENPIGRSKKPSRKEICMKLPYYPGLKTKSVNGYTYHRVYEHRAVYDANLNSISLEKFIEQVSKNPNHNLIFSDKNMIIHHIDENPFNNSIDNLQLMTKLEHDTHHASRKAFGAYQIKEDKIISINEYGEEDTYDIQMKDPYNNFIAEGIVVHNSGKSAFSNKMLFDILDHPKNQGRVIVLYWSFEMPAYQQLLRIGSSKVGRNVSEILSVENEFQDVDFKQFVEKMNLYKKYPIYFNNHARDVTYVSKITKRVASLNPDKTIINLFDHSRLFKKEKQESELQMLTDLSHTCVELQQATSCITILLSQLNRNIESNDRAANLYQPMLSDIFGSDSLSNDATAVMIINRPYDMYNITQSYCNQNPRGLLALHFEKNREAELGMLPFNCDMSTFTIEER